MAEPSRIHSRTSRLIDSTVEKVIDIAASVKSNDLIKLLKFLI